MTINVTQEDIDSGEKSNAYSCPVAKAIVRATNGTTYIMVTPRIICIGPLDRNTPERVKKFVIDFDADRPVSPFYFNLDI